MENCCWNGATRALVQLFLILYIYIKHVAHALLLYKCKQQLVSKWSLLHPPEIESGSLIIFAVFILNTHSTILWQMNPRQFLPLLGMKDRNILPLGCISPFRWWWVIIRPPSAVFRKKCTTCSSWLKWVWLLPLLMVLVALGSTGGDPWNMSTWTNHWIWVDQRPARLRLMVDSKLPGSWLLLLPRLPPSLTWWRSISVYARQIMLATMKTVVVVCSYSRMSRILKRILHPAAHRMTPLRADPSK